MSHKRLLAVWLVVTLLVLVSILGLPHTLATGIEQISQDTIVVDGLIDDDYGPPVASDPPHGAGGKGADPRHSDRT